MATQMRKRSLLLLMAILTTTSLAAVDLSDFDEESMRAIEDASKELQTSIRDQDAATTIANAEFVRDSLKWAESYFAKKGGAEDAVQLAIEGQLHADAIAAAAKASNFDAANESFDSLKKSCKTCHDVYKPPKL
jgi:cytochrome c556